MIPLARCTRPEAAANLLLGTFRNVLVQAHYDNKVRIRFRADLVDAGRVFFGKVPSQIRSWRAHGGLLISWRRVDAKEGPHDAILFAECPRSIEAIYSGAHLTRHMAVVYVPPTWRLHEDTIIGRQKNAHPWKFAKHMKQFEIMRDYVRTLPALSRPYLLRQSRARLAAFPPSSAPALSASAAPPANTPR